MASKQRENNRRIKKRNKQKKARIIIWAVLILIIIVLVVMRVVEVNFNSVKDRFTGSNGSSVSADAGEGNFPYKLDSSAGVKMNYQVNRLNVLTDSSCTIIDPKNAESLYSFKHGFANPVTKTSGTYFCTIDQGTQRIRLDNLKSKEYEFETDGALLCADVAKNGTVVYATSSSEDKSTLFVVTKSRKQLLKYTFNKGYIVSVAIDSSGKRCAFSAINSKNARLVTTVYTINTGDKKPRASFDHSSNTLSLHYCGDNLYFVGDNGVYLITSQKKQKEIYKAGKINTVCFCYGKNDELILVYSEYSSASENRLVHISSSGKEKLNIKLSKKPKSVTSVSNEICLLFGDNIKVYSLSKGEETGNYKCDDSVTCAYKLSTKIYVAKGQQIDVIE